jgi:hypothetical protein
MLYIDWIQGHDLGRKFKALVCHDGNFSTQSLWGTDELFFLFHDFGGGLWDYPKGFTQWDPARHTDQWATPQLVDPHPSPCQWLIVAFYTC